MPVGKQCIVRCNKLLWNAYMEASQVVLATNPKGEIECCRRVLAVRSTGQRLMA